MQTFTTTQLANNHVLVEGTSGDNSYTTTLCGCEWHEIKQLEKDKQATSNYDNSVRDFFAPLTDAANAYDEATAPLVDPDFFYVIEEETQAQEGKEAVVVDLKTDTVILRLLERGDYSRLRWVRTGGEDTIVVTAQAEPEVQVEEPFEVYDLLDLIFSQGDVEVVEEEEEVPAEEGETEDPTLF